MSALSDESLMPWGKHKDKRMIDVPAHYLLWLYDEKKCAGEVLAYIEDNLDVLREEVKRSPIRNMRYV